MTTTYVQGYEPKDKHLCPCSKGHFLGGDCGNSVKNEFKYCFECKDHSQTAEIKDALSKINYGVKEGFYQPEDIKGMNNSQMIDFVKGKNARV